MIRIILLLSLALLSQVAAADGVYKCSSGGKTSYADRPCTTGVSTRLPPPAAGVTPPEASAVATRDARTLVEFDKLRLAREKDEAKAERERQRQVRAAAAHRKTCDKLRLRRKWAAEDLARAGGKAQEAARRKAKRQAEALAVECPA